MIPENKLVSALWEADRHLNRLTEALIAWDASPSVTWNDLESNRDRVRIVDQLLFRFIKLQDTVGERLLPATLSQLRESFEEWPMRDQLNRLEKLGYLDVNTWLAWREVRNMLAHEYEDNPEIRFATLMVAIDAAKALTALYRNWRTRLQPSSL